jgi:hypothetical protein
LVYSSYPLYTIIKKINKEEEESGGGHEAERSDRESLRGDETG